jgi:ferritin-like metal-binding protein YciE
LKTIIQAALTSKVVLREGGTKRSISKLEGIVLRQVESALKGNEKAALATLKMAAQVGLLDRPESEIEAASLSASEQEMIEELLSQGTRKRKRRPRT